MPSGSSTLNDCDGGVAGSYGLPASTPSQKRCSFPADRAPACLGGGDDTDEANVDQQWLGQAPYANFHWLEEGPGLVRIGDQGSYALFRVGSG